MRIAIVNDVHVAREALRRVLLASAEHEVAWTAKDGAEAIEQASKDRPDLILMDLFMPGTDGVEATRRIMSESPCAILVVTSTVSGHLNEVYQAMGHGDRRDRHPDVRSPGRDRHQPAALEQDRPHRQADRQGGGTVARWAEPSDSPVGGMRLALEPGLDPLVVLGASTGGPQAVLKILSALPPNLEAGIILLQHIDVGFAKGFGEWLSEQTGRMRDADHRRAPARRRRDPAPPHLRPPGPGRGSPASLLDRAENELLPSLGRCVLLQCGSELVQAGRGRALDRRDWDEDGRRRRLRISSAIQAGRPSLGGRGVPASFPTCPGPFCRQDRRSPSRSCHLPRSPRDPIVQARSAIRAAQRAARCKRLVRGYP